MLDHSPLLEVQCLGVAFGSNAAVSDLNFQIGANETVAVVGESGSGKSTTALALLGLLPASAEVTGRVLFNGEDLLGRSNHSLEDVRGSQIAYVPQNPFGSLNPVYTVGYQIVETIRAHDKSVDNKTGRLRALELIDAVGIDNPEARFDAYPHQLSGGMRQRVVIAIALANQPSLIIADEPTSALDVTVQAQVMDALERAQKLSSASLLLITHDLGLVARHADRVLVMYGGRCVESGTVETVFSDPRMPYTMGLLGAVPRIDIASDDALVRMPPPAPRESRGGCPFVDRCPAAIERCSIEVPRPSPVGAGGHEAACFRSHEMGTTTALELFPTTAASPVPSNSAATPHQVPALTVTNLVKHFTVRDRTPGRRGTSTVHAVCDISLEVMPGETLAIVGESGSGKTTLNRTLVRMEEPSAGGIMLVGQDISHLSQRKMRPIRSRLQMVLQDSTASLNPKISVGALIGEPLIIHKKHNESRVAELLSLVGLPAAVAGRFPGELSGGQRQRVAIARALAVEPEILLLDEPVSALDVSVQADILALLRDIQRRLEVSYIFVTHDLGVVRHIADRVAVMYLGRLVEVGSVDDVLSRPAHPYARALVSAVPVPDPVIERSRQRIMLKGEVPAASRPPSGCRFRTRCPLFATLDEVQQQVCIDIRPSLYSVGGSAQEVACHFVDRGMNELATPFAVNVTGEPAVCAD